MENKSNNPIIKIYVDARWLHQYGQGVSTYILELYNALLNLTESADFEVYFGVENLEFDKHIQFNPRLNFVVVGKKNMLWRLFLYPFFLKKFNFDFAHFQYITPIYSFKTVYINTIHDILFFSDKKNFPLKFRLLTTPLFYLSSVIAKILLTVSENSKNDLIKYFKPSKEIHVLYNGFPRNTISEIQNQKKILDFDYFLMVGRVEPRKNYSKLINIWTQFFSEKNQKLVIVGWCNEMYLKKFKEDINNSKNVVWLNNISDKELSNLYFNATGFIYPSISEGFGIPLIEAISYNLPVAISNTYPLHDVSQLITNQFSPFDDIQIRNSISRMMEGEIGYNLSGVNEIREKYSWNASAKKLVHLLKNYVDGH